MRRFALLTFFIFIVLSGFAQNSFLKGTITDTINKKNLTNTVISLLRAKDSILYKFTRSDSAGRFELKNLQSGSYVLLITHQAYVDYVDEIEVKENQQTELGIVKMTLTANILKEVVVQQKIGAIRLKGDTTEFAADSFKVREGASVEEMLKKLPGIQVDKDGKITALGEKVEKVLVDGEEFFGDDPTIATRNLQADAIDKVQVFDKKSDQATFTGIDDGQREKTINLKLKDDKKKGFFGKLDIGSNLGNRWNNSAMINRFRSKLKLSAYGIMSSTGKTGLDWDESNKYGTGMNMDFDEDGGGFFIWTGGGDDEFNNSQYEGEGIPKSWSAGVNYSNKFNDDKQSLNGSYRFNKLNSQGNGSVISQSILPDTVFVNTERSNSFSSRLRHSLNGTYEWQFDSSSSMKITASGYSGKFDGFSHYTGQSVNEFGSVVNNSLRNTSTTGNNNNVNANVLFRKKFKKPGRTLSLNLNEIYNGNSSDGYLFSVIEAFDKGGISIANDTTDQKKVNNTSTNEFGARVTYTEPITKRLFLQLNYSLKSTKSDAEKLSYDRTGLDKYDLLNDTFSNHYKFDVFTNAAGLSFKYNTKKVTLGLGSDVARTNFSQTDLLRDSISKRDYTNFFPKANFTYKINGTSRISINYNGRTTQPTIQQIQPVADNSNPLIITIGNPLLKQKFTHTVYYNFNSYKVLSQRGIYMYGSISATQNDIVTSTTIDSSNRTVYQYINTNGNYNTYSGLGYSIKIKKIDANLNINVNYNNSHYNNIVNGIKNTTVNSSPGIGFGIGKNKEKKFDFYYYNNFSYNTSSSSINTALKTHYWTQSHNLNLNIQLPGKIEINNELEFELRQKTELFTGNNNIFLWNAYIGRKLLKDDKALIKISAFDILNQNKGYSRNINSTVLEENRYETIKRYFLISFVWNFSKNAASMNE